MSLHDAYARVTPFELAFDEPGRAAALAEATRAEAEGRGVDPTTLEGFLTLGSVESYVREVAGPDADVAALHRFGPLAFHSVRFDGLGRPLFLLTTHVARYLVGGAPEGAPEPPSEAGYVQLPQHLFWMQVGDAPESVDGVFWSTNARGALHALAVTGIRPDRPGVGVVPLPEAPLADAVQWLELDARGDGRDFASELPGAELDGLYEIRAAGELFKLMARFFSYVTAVPASDAVSPPADALTPAPSRLPYRRLTLDPPGDPHAP